MKKRMLIWSLVLSVSLLSAGCSALPETPVLYSNLTEESIRYDLNSLLQQEGVPDARRAVLFDHVDQINGLLRQDQLTEGFSPLKDPAYDVYALQDAWMEKYPDFLGYNCRITAFSLYENAFQALPDPEIPPSIELLEFDLNALDTDNSAFPDRERQFLSLFSPVPTEATREVSVHAEHVKNTWADRGIVFDPDRNMSMINMYFHMQDGDRDLLYVGHSGILLPTPDGDLWFLEKLAFQQPYQLVKFRSRRQLQTYLMEKYDLDEGQPTARPFIMENDGLMKA